MVTNVEISKLNAATYNPRIELLPGMADFEKLKTSIEELGFAEPIVWNKRTGNVVGGHQRLAVCKHLGYTSVPCSIVDLDEKDEKVLNIALNKIKGQWDYEKVEEILRNFDYEVATISGFAAEEIAVILANNDDLDDDYGDFDDWDGDTSAAEEAETIVGGSYVVTLVFANAELADAWATERGYKNQVKDGSSTTVIRIESLEGVEA